MKADSNNLHKLSIDELQYIQQQIMYEVWRRINKLVGDEYRS
jgi:hypothetical protein